MLNYSQIGGTIQVSVKLFEMSRQDKQILLHDLMRDFGLNKILADNPDIRLEDAWAKMMKS